MNPRRADCHPEREHYAHGECRPCYMRRYAAGRLAIVAAQQRERYRLRPTFYRAKARRQLYGISAEDYRSLVIGQAGRCLVCGRVPDHDLHVDHDHLTGKIRGLLCNQCNRGIGLLSDDPHRLRAAVRYLEAAS